MKKGYLVNNSFTEDPYGSLWLYSEPQPTHNYAIGSDVAEGVEGDASASVVLDIETNDTVACFISNKIDPDQFAVFNKDLGLYYNTAFLGVERNAVGFSVVSDLVKSYPNNQLYFSIRLDEKKKIKTKKFGWISDQRTRHLMLSYLKQEIRECSTKLYDKRLIQQCLTFRNIDGKPQAAEGEHDDAVIARAIAGMMRREKLSRGMGTKTFIPQDIKSY